LGNEKDFPRKEFTMPEIDEPTAPDNAVDEPRKPISEAKLQANRRNGSLGHGPVTPAGKRRSSLNATRSGIHGQIVCATAEELAILQKHTADVLAELTPVGPTETFLAVSISENMWRISRIRAIEAGIFATGFRENIDSIDAGHPEVDAALVASDTWMRQSKEIVLLSVYEGRLSRLIERNRAELKTLQADRKEARAKALNQAAIFVEHAENKGQIYDPGEDFQPASAHGGFVFSHPEVAGRRDRERRYKIACHYHFRDRSKDPRPDLGPIIDVKAA
jgi:hypothetical protein